MYLSRPPGALKSLIRLNVGLRTGYDLGYIAFLSETAQVLPIALTAINLSLFDLKNQIQTKQMILN